MTLSSEVDLDSVKVEPPCKISQMKVILFESNHLVRQACTAGRLH